MPGFLTSPDNDQLDIQIPGCQIGAMNEQGIHTVAAPELKKPVLIASFEGWGNALNISKGMADYLIRILGAEFFARINSDLFYRYDETRPLVNIEDGVLKSISAPGGSFYAVQSPSEGRDLVILSAHEPNLRWFQFVNDLSTFCENVRVETVITLGSMYDNVHHSDRIVSGIASNEVLTSKLKEKKVHPIFYQGPSAIHSLVQSEVPKRGIPCISLWSHCPYYVRGVTHFGILSHLGALLSYLGDFKLNLDELNASWEKLNAEIQKLIENNPDLQKVIQELRKAKLRGSWASMRESGKKGEKIINLKDFLEPK
jgi:proteasome assembly chaperone (PAC2) family protein